MGAQEAGGAAGPADAQFRRMVATEERIAELTPAISRLGRAVLDLQLPSGRGPVAGFAGDALAADLQSAPEPVALPGGSRLGLESWEWGVEPVAAPVSARPAGLWGDVWALVDHFESAKFGVLRGGFDAGGDDFTTELAFTGRARDGRGAILSLKGGATVTWRRGEGEFGWQVASWQSHPMRAVRLASPLFEECLRTAVPEPEAYAAARRSVHEDYIRQVFLTGGTTFHYKKEFWQYLVSWDSLDQHPSVSVVDFDGDGWDDLYVTGRWGRNQLWRNRGDGTFSDVAAEVGLDLDGMCNCALFADFDNDGDQDAFVGRSLERGRYFMNESGQFIDRSETHVSVPLPFWTSSLAAADYNADGLLDLYISTYRLPITKPQNILAAEFLDPDQREEWKRRRAGDHPVFRLTGPPNLLLVNRGDGRFEPAPESGQTELWLSSFQSTWSDYDNDGDPDLFVANDYAPDCILRNDPGEGRGRRFTDVTQTLAGDELQGFGMGVSLADYDLDGRQDLFFTYMFSKAGSRITAMFDGLEERMYQGARGNKLFHNRGDAGFALVSGPAPPAMEVAKTGWSWGGQFADLDNDCFPDLYVSNGYYTPPAETATEVDL